MRGPRIEILDSNGHPKSPKAQEISYAVGDKIELRCNSAPSKPAARLRWYLNDHELVVPNSAPNSSDARQAGRQGYITPSNAAIPPLGYDVRVTPIEYRQHYKGIYSSHSTLSLVLQQDDLVNSKISFKCLASMRQEVPIQSKQLIVLTPQPAGSLSSNSRLRAKRLSSNQSGDTDGGQRRHKAQYNRHSMSRASSRSQQQQQQNAPTMSSDLISSLPEDLKNHMMYIYEDSDSTLGPSIIDGPETLERYIHSNLNETENANHNQLISGNNLALEFNRADNSEYIQLLRDRLSRQRSLPNAQQGANGASGSTSSHKRLYGSSSLVKSPLYLDEHDPLRPIISWPPLESGKLMLLPPGQTIVAIPTQPNAINKQQNELKFVLPPKSDPTDAIMHRASTRTKVTQTDDPAQLGQIMLDRLIENLNCTCTDSSIDTKLGWIVNDVPLNSRDTRFYPTRISPDHRQTLITIGIQANANQQATSAASLQSILSQYFKTIDSSSHAMHLHATSAALRFDSRSKTSTDQQVLVSNEQIRFICQAVHSLLLYSSSEMITFDFNPPPINQIDSNSIDKFQSLSSNVIQATSGKSNTSLVHGLFLY